MKKKGVIAALVLAVSSLALATPAMASAPLPGDEEVCMGKLGCFIITDDFFQTVYRPINFLPQSR
jgi:hypothetical protein